MIVVIVLAKTSRPIKYDSAVNVYQKGDMYCVLHLEGDELIVHKYPMTSIFRVEESYE